MIYFSPYLYSGRIRQEGLGEALIQLLVNDSNKCPELVNPYPENESWQWVSCRLDMVTGANVTVVMTVRTTDSQSSVAGIAYFDDLCLTFQTRNPGSGKGSLMIM